MSVFEVLMHFASNGIQAVQDQLTNVDEAGLPARPLRSQEQPSELHTTMFTQVTFKQDEYAQPIVNSCQLEEASHYRAPTWLPPQDYRKLVLIWNVRQEGGHQPMCVRGDEENKQGDFVQLNVGRMGETIEDGLESSPIFMHQKSRLICVQCSAVSKGHQLQHQLLHSDPANELGKQQMVGSSSWALHPCGRPRRCLQIPAMDRPSSIHCGHLRIETEDRRSSLSPFLCLSLSVTQTLVKIIKIYSFLKVLSISNGLIRVLGSLLKSQGNVLEAVTGCLFCAATLC